MGSCCSRRDRERTAYHESGHALVGMLTPEADPVRQVTIIPRGMALGVTLSTPDVDRVSYTREELEAQIKVALGGRVAEEVVYGTITTGAESDIEQLTRIARQMVGQWGMSEQVRPDRAAAARRRRALPRRERGVAPDPGRSIDEEVQRLVDDAHRAVTALLTDHRAAARQPRLRAPRRRDARRPAAYAAAMVPPRPSADAGQPADDVIPGDLTGPRRISTERDEGQAVERHGNVPTDGFQSRRAF